jgi:hypothetical protein
MIVKAGANGKEQYQIRQRPKKTKRYCHHMCLQFYFYYQVIEAKVLFYLIKEF